MGLTKKAERTRAKLLESAKRLIGERGFDKVSVEDITRDSGVAKGTFYHYFKCKEDVVAELSFQSCQATTEKSIHFDGPVDERCYYYVTALCKDAAWAGVRLIRQWIRETMESEEEDSEAKAALYNIYDLRRPYENLRRPAGHRGRRTYGRRAGGYAGQAHDEPFLRCTYHLVHDERLLEPDRAVREVHGNRY